MCYGSCADTWYIEVFVSNKTVHVKSGLTKPAAAHADWFRKMLTSLTAQLF